MEGGGEGEALFRSAAVGGQAPGEPAGVGVQPLPDTLLKPLTSVLGAAECLSVILVLPIFLKASKFPALCLPTAPTAFASCDFRCEIPSC